ncbi:SAM-dependent methyltransferase [Ureibacillus massiliensis 4400831 = CIP 108448 = CCUG 49529]|uniref:Release factor glutamine methyltransferase n=1 Tax=Ureibacillus massiliensis 4400831 = CIP 108448 = CCUG 49529 TaxID=1211035 RepID=A0A0A3J613_9BACL|nr:peptide chain release factor N(5)-glutamine methyltransferase [Ureibacillus massiliensis]KGR92474.1 SAM-dependent methyltransferase [Ureibacillus massiliensis 4400831 = CIP 108448 = CCUG 49529]
MMKHKTNYEALQWASSFLLEHGRDENAARLLLQNVLKTNYSGLMMRMHDEITSEQLMQFELYVKQHAEGKPVQYITGVEEFYGRTYQVDESVLIPRPETEELIEGTLKRIQTLFGDKKELNIVDIGTGSGAIGITMKLEYPTANVTATDISEAALQTAKKNAKLLNAEIDFRLGDLTEPIRKQKWDVVLSNPPYIAFQEAEEMSEVVLAHEPHNALFAEEDGLILYRKLAENLPNLLNKPALIGVEIGYTQAVAVANFFKNSFPQAKIEIVKDINKKNRMIFCEIHE